MGSVLSCCNKGSSEEEDSLLRAQQAGYGSNINDGDADSYTAEQQRLQDEERVAQARENQLRDIVNATNDKMIDISMITNSGIVIQSNDQIDEVRKFADKNSETGDGNDNYLAPVSSNLAAIMSNSGSLHNNNNNNNYTSQNSTHSRPLDDQILDDISHTGGTTTSASTKAVFVTLDTNGQMTKEDKDNLKAMHQQIKKSLEDQLKVEPLGSLVMTF
ncbi:similar to Saccharomyces cerevisiae YKR007W MEH1 Component of the EGO complex [Maudiozyma barnettii]|uniref:Similar to Saccharomyces cerevisiae YKR007W MEH1 Component of the EGO complex n=1 Tax=Maudiozyma barnettii TaxID=61262 RepID=A0A8H2VIX5_9SACH|nr:Meh1p [Kazachstania barnettii]CAB4256400.1 similar to Saccharomyces cerevisiae YKR007W MEH1 Component of the EGO complex [Kazachstania barnettii]CAD1785009.1 similar to Saccharomyces cerevisiae YKR007W MEH1 Component of the EGO complex [Kazachstania barnettii]